MIQSIALLLMAFFARAAGVAPTIDLSHNMRILKLPMDIKPGSLIYRLRGTDPDNDVLTFGVRGDVGNQLLSFESVADSINWSNVFLKSAPTEKEYKLTIYVTDGTQTTEVESTIIITNATNQKSPFLEYDSLITVSELTEEKEVIGSVVVRKRNSSSLPVLFEVEGSEKFAIRYVISPLKESTKAEISLVQRLDYEKKNLYPLTIYALNSWTDEEVDTRNVAVLNIFVAVQDSQDTPPVFHSMPPVVRVSDSLLVGGFVTQIIAEDGDYGNQRNITYSFVPDSPGVTYFNINSRTGIITLASSTELLRDSYSTSGPFVMSIQASEVETPSIPGLPASSVATLAVVLVNTENKPPRFLSRRYVGTIEENSPGLTPVIWEGTEAPKVVDDDQGKNGSFELFLEDDDGAFSVQPSRGMNELNFALLVKNPLKLDYETSDTKYIEFRIVARETASARPLSATAEIRVKLVDANDNVPQFTHDIYNVTLPEDAPPGTTLAKIQATDEDSGSYGVVRYTAVNGPIAGNLRLDPVSGELTLLSGEGLDRERVPEYSLTVEARDDQGRGGRSSAEVRVLLADANDNAPLFLQPRYDAVLNPDMRNFYEPLRVQAYDADGPGPNSDITYEIVNGNYQEKFYVDPHTGELSLQAPLVPNPESQDHGLPVITLTVRAHDQGVPVRSATVKVQVHNQEYLNRSISFVTPLSVQKASERRQELERGFSTLTGAHVNLQSIAFHNSSTEKSVVRCWVSYPLSSTVDLSNIEAIISNMFGRDFLQTSKVEAINRNSFDVVFWLLIALVILMILAILALFFYCCCVRTEGRDFLELKNKVAPEENVIHYKEGVTVQMNNEARRPDSRTRNSWVENNNQANQQQTTSVKKSHTEEPPHQSPQHRQAAVHLSEPLTTSYAQNTEELPVRGAYYGGDGGIPAVVAGGRMERAFRRGRPLSPGEADMEATDARRLGNYVVVRKVVRPRVRVDPVEDSADDPEHGPRRTEILYIRSPMREDEEERHYIREGELLRSVSETALNNSDDPHLRVPVRAYRAPRHRVEPDHQQLKFSRYHRTEGDVIIATDDTADGYPPHDSHWGGPQYQHPPGDYVMRPLRLEQRWSDHPDYPPRHPAEDYRGMMRPPQPPDPGYARFQPQYGEPSNRPYAHQQLPSVEQVQRTLPPQPAFEPHREPEPEPSNELEDRAEEDPDNEDSRTVVMAPSHPVMARAESEEQQEEPAQDHVTFQDQDIQDQHEPAPEEPPEDFYARKQSLRPLTQHRQSTDDSGAVSGRDKLEDTDVMDSRETHEEESDRLGRTAEDSRTEDQNPHTEDEDSDSGIGKDGAGTALRLKKSNLMEKKSLFTIAYDGMQTRGLKSAGERDDSP